MKEYSLPTHACPACGYQFRRNEKRGAVLTIWFEWGVAMVGVCRRCAVRHQRGTERQRERLTLRVAGWFEQQYARYVAASETVH